MLLLSLFWISSAQARVPACEPIDTDAEAKAAWARWQDESMAAALGPLEVVWNDLDKACPSPDAEQRSQLAQAAGAIAFYGGDTATAERWFERAVRAAPEVGYSANLGSGPEPTFQEVQDRLAAHQDPHKGLTIPRAALIAGAGGALIGSGELLWRTTFAGPYADCLNPEIVGVDLDPKLADMARCDQILDEHLRLRLAGSVGLIAIGGAASAAGLSLSVVASQRELSVGVSGVW